MARYKGHIHLETCHFMWFVILTVKMSYTLTWMCPKTPENQKKVHFLFFCEKNFLKIVKKIIFVIIFCARQFYYYNIRNNVILCCFRDTLIFTLFNTIICIYEICYDTSYECSWCNFFLCLQKFVYVFFYDVRTYGIIQCMK